jgi:hypothetical protein
MKSRFPLDSLLICEWSLEIAGYDPDLFQSKEDVEDLRKAIEKEVRRKSKSGI